MPEMQETQFHSLGREDPLEEEMATHSRILAWEIPRTEEPRGLQPIGPQKTQTQLSGSTTKMFIVALFTISKKWDQLKCSLIDDWIKRTSHTHTLEYYSAKDTENKLLVTGREALKR